MKHQNLLKIKNIFTTIPFNLKFVNIFIREYIFFCSISSFDIKKDYNTRDMFNYCNMTTIKIKKDSNETLVKQIPNKTTIVKK